jgi:hypothetical protein
MYSIGTSQINNADPVIIKTEKVNIKDRLLLIPKDWIFFGVLLKDMQQQC